LQDRINSYLTKEASLQDEACATNGPVFTEKKITVLHCTKLFV